MENIIITKEGKYKNQTLQKQTERMFALGGNIKKAFFGMSAIIADVEAKECFKDDGFNSVHDWTKDAFGFQKSQSYAFLKIGKEYLSIVRDENGKIKQVRSNLTPDDSPIDYGMTQIQKLLPLGHDKAKEICYDGTVNPRMTVKEIDAIVKGILKDEDEDETDENTVDTEAEVTPTEEVFVEVLTKDGTLYRIPESVLSNYKA